MSVNAVAWRRLSDMNLKLNLKTHTRRFVGMRKGVPRYQISVSEDVSETARVLGSGDDEAVKARLFWFATFHPSIYNGVIEETK